MFRSFFSWIIFICSNFLDREDLLMLLTTRNLPVPFSPSSVNLCIVSSFSRGQQMRKPLYRRQDLGMDVSCFLYRADRVW
jgi:hypothetical protein